MRDDQGEFLDSRLAMTDPDKYAWDRLIPALQKKGISADDNVAVSGADVEAVLEPNAKPLLTKDLFVAYAGVIAQLQNLGNAGAAGRHCGHGTGEAVGRDWRAQHQVFRREHCGKIGAAGVRHPRRRRRVCGPDGRQRASTDGSRAGLAL
ncbi:hypothetical protein [Bradyrhizobium sp. JYMT SZCCT0428]|uniref:hypothetical protein n=1 Tax=Bradyrhizobium sp. JYMT SZCCT0428 TaxID=2807673 RepID=UPI001BAE2A58|nr:hypothetical protein [Bradyrhizobium sp. JYMT SZCCT0428]MBR1154604.1 hypothetical protein [Bradyrhizobium sp. JYMT SZCCT0428]